jgi:Uma2 family endonuclease
MTVAEFLAWNPEDGTGRLWQLRDGEPEAVPPAYDAHGSIQAELGRLIGNHLAESGCSCRAVMTPGVIPRLRSDRNLLVPDIGVTCAPPSGTHALPEPVVLIEVLSPNNEWETRANVWAYMIIPSVREILIISSVAVAAEVLRRQPDGAWPAQPEFVQPDGDLRLECIGFTAPLRAAYRTSGVVG